MAEVTINEVRMVVEDALNSVRQLATDAKRAAEEAKNHITQFGNYNSHHSLESTIKDIRNMVQDIRNHHNQIAETHTHAQNTDRTVAVLQQHMQRVDANTTATPHLQASIQHMQGGFSDLNQRVCNIEQVMNDLTFVLQELQNQLAVLQKMPSSQPLQR